MVGKRERFAQLMDRTHLSEALLAVRARTPPSWLSILCYHRVGTPAEDDVLPDETYDASSSTFAEQLRFLSERCHFVSTDELVDYVHGRPLPPNPVMITFDDGYRECLTHALPLLEDYGARATFFIATDYVEHRKLFWWDRIGLYVSRAKKDPIELDYPRKMVLTQAEAYPALNKLVKTEVGMDLERFLSHLAERAEADVSAEEEKALVDRLIMTWDEVDQLVKAGMDVQSHTCSHRVIQTLLPEQLHHEFTGSRELLEERLSIPIRTLAYPVGDPIGEAPKVRRALEEAGYEAAYTSQTGPVPMFRSLDRFQVNRIIMSEDYRGSFFRSVMAWPPLAFS